ncbi:MAG TPA: ATP-binding cassette domain-containing protein, partial [Desulfobacter sp.]|nr:ATP-binding cassette domain-containing protein [Desulfobacter sp.]
MIKKTSFAIEVAHLTVSYNAKPALLDVNVKIEADQLVGVIGPNGAGKSTFIKAILGFVKPDLGTVKIQGTHVK